MSSGTPTHRLPTVTSGRRHPAATLSSRKSSFARPLPSSQTSRVPSGPPRQSSTGHVSSQLAPPWPFNPQETALIRAGYRPAFTPAPVAADQENASSQKTKKMAEPRARAARHKGQMNFASERMYSVICYCPMPCAILSHRGVC